MVKMIRFYRSSPCPVLPLTCSDAKNIMHKGYLSEFGMKKPVNRIQSSCSWSWSSPAARTCSGWLAGRCYCCLSGEEFKCHKVILAGRSTVFDAMFTHNLMEKNENKVEVEDVDADNIKEMLVFIYSGKV